MKAAGYIFLGLLLAILLYASVERFTVTIQSDDKDTTPVVKTMDTPTPTPAMSTTAPFAAPMGLTNSAASLAPPLPAALQPPVPIPPPPTPPPPNPIVARIANFNAQREEFMRSTVDPIERERSIATSAFFADPSPENRSRREDADRQQRAAIDTLNEMDGQIQRLTEQLAQ